MRDISCPFCSAERTKLFFNDGGTGTKGYRCVKCGCTFIVLKKGKIPEPVPAYYDDDEDRDDHASNNWPNNRGR